MMAGSWYTGALLVVAFVWFPAATVQAEPLRADYTINFYPPDPFIGIDLTGTGMGGTLTLYHQFDPADDLIAVPGSGPLNIAGLTPGESRTGSWDFDLDLSTGNPTFFVSFSGMLYVPDPNLPYMPPVFVFEVGAEPTEAPAAAPLISVGTYVPPSPILPDLIAPPSLLNAPLFAFASVHEVGSLSVAVQPVPVPLPSAALLAMAGVSAVGALRRRLR